MRQFLPQHSDPDTLIGDPAGDMAHWHMQRHPDTCAIAVQEFMLEQATGHEFSEGWLREQAMSYHWYTPGEGTPFSCVGNLLEANGLTVERHFGLTLDDLATRLDHDELVMAVVDSHEIWSPGQHPLHDDLVSDFPGIPGQDRNHAVQVIGIDRSDPHHPMVILNDPGHPDGRGMLVPAEEFLNAWQDSGCYTICVQPDGQHETAVDGLWGFTWARFSPVLSQNINSVIRTV